MTAAMTRAPNILENFIKEWNVLLQYEQNTPIIQTLDNEVPRYHPWHPNQERQHRDILMDWLVRTALPECLSIAGLDRWATALLKTEPFTGNPAPRTGQHITILQNLSNLLREAVKPVHQGTSRTNQEIRLSGYAAATLSGERPALHAVTTPPTPYPYLLISTYLHEAAPYALIIKMLDEHSGKPPETIGAQARITLGPTVEKLQRSAADLCVAMGSLANDKIT